jgi:formylglycine-generating enzyme required for sulfatase activity
MSAVPEAKDLSSLTLDERFLVEIALKNGLLARVPLERALQERAALERERGEPVAFDRLLVERGLLSPRHVERIRRAQAATHALRLDAVYAETARRLGVVDEAALDALLDERRRAPRLDRIGDELLERGAIAPEDHARILREMRRAIDAGEEAYVASLRARGAAPRPPPPPPPAAPPPERTPAAKRARPAPPEEEPRRRPAEPKERPRDAAREPAAPPPKRRKEERAEAERRPPAPPAVEEPEEAEGAREDDASDEDLFDSAVRSLAEMSKAEGARALKARDLAEVDESLSKAGRRPARGPARAKLPSGQAARPAAPLAGGAPRSARLPILIVLALACAGGLAYTLSGGGGDEDAPVEVVRRPREREGAGGGAREPGARPGSAPGTRPEAGTTSGASAGSPPRAREPAPEGAPGPSSPSGERPPAPADFQRLFNEGQVAERGGRLDQAADVYRRALAAAGAESAKAALVRARLDIVERSLSEKRAAGSMAEELWARAFAAIREGRMEDALAPLDTLAGTHRDDRAIRAAVFVREVRDMVYVPRGPFLIGMDEADAAHCKPRRRLEIGAYFIDRKETTNADYLAFVQAVGAQRPLTWVAPGASPIPGDEELPVVTVTQDEAARYAAWKGRRLPTEEEWERAARGTDGRRFPWGAEEPRGRANVAAGEAAGGGLRAVGSFPGDVSPAGCLDMAGNAAEWTSSPFLCYPAGDARSADFSPAMRVVRGGSWRFDGAFARCAWRDRASPGDRMEVVGFRCARDVPPWLEELR